MGVRAKTALHAWIVIFGHGNETGLSFRDSMSLDDINRFVEQQWTEALQEEPKELPAKVEIIYSQCYGHIFDHSIVAARFKVVALTNNAESRTICNYDDDGKCSNQDLTDYAKKRRPKIAAIESTRNAPMEKEVDQQCDNEKEVDAASEVSSLSN